MPLLVHDPPLLTSLPCIARTPRPFLPTLASCTPLLSLSLPLATSTPHPTSNCPPLTPVSGCDVRVSALDRSGAPNLKKVGRPGQPAGTRAAHLDVCPSLCSTCHWPYPTRPSPSPTVACSEGTPRHSPMGPRSASSPALPPAACARRPRPRPRPAAATTITRPSSPGPSQPSPSSALASRLPTTASLPGRSRARAPSGRMASSGTSAGGRSSRGRARRGSSPSRPTSTQIQSQEQPSSGLGTSRCTRTRPCRQPTSSCLPWRARSTRALPGPPPARCRLSTAGKASLSADADASQPPPPSSSQTTAARRSQSCPNGPSRSSSSRLRFQRPSPCGHPQHRRRRSRPSFFHRPQHRRRPTAHPPRRTSLSTIPTTTTSTPRRTSASLQRSESSCEGAYGRPRRTRRRATLSRRRSCAPSAPTTSTPSSGHSEPASPPTCRARPLLPRLHRRRWPRSARPSSAAASRTSSPSHPRSRTG